MKRKQSRLEEIFNSLSHGIGVGLSLVGLWLLMDASLKSGNFVQTVGFFIYGLSLFLLYLASALYHGAKSDRAKHFLRIFDHSSIYLLIAGTYTPLCLSLKPPVWGVVMLSTLWPLAIAGIVFKIFFTGRFRSVSTLIYLGMGWMALIAIKPFFNSISLPGLMLVATGGFFYTFGVIFYALERVPFFHLIWHLFVLSGSSCHYLAILWYVAPLF